MRACALIICLLVLPSCLQGITTVNNNNPKDNPKPVEKTEDQSSSLSDRINITERHRRLIPYMTFYLTRDFNRPSNNLQNFQEPRTQPQQYHLLPQKITVQPYHGKFIVVNQIQPKYTEPPPVIYQPKLRFTPFLDSNKLPGGFTPMRNSQPIRVQVLKSPAPVVVNKEPDYNTIFDKLLQLKQLQYTKEPQYDQFDNPAQYYTTSRPVTKFIAVENYPKTQPEKTYIHTYTPANIDLTNENKIQNYENFESLKTYNQIPAPIPAKEYERVIPVKNYQNEEQVQYHQPQPQNQNKENNNNYQPIVFGPIYRPVPVVKNYRPIYQQTEQPILTPETENPHSLSVILKQLQDSNTLPQTLTPDNIDNSIKTLVNILNELKQTQKFQKPIVVAQIDDTEENTEENIEDYDEDIPETISQSFPANTQEGGTPGKPGIDYPAYSFIPQTDFNCKKQRYKGFFGDPDTSCQVWHYCDLNGGQASFLCPNGTIFSQVALTCDWWYNVKCATTTQLYVLNERLYKYILPFTPKFPEDYSGPLVDRYLALKFKEMEEKMKKQKKEKTENPIDDVPDEANKLQDIQNEEELTAESKENTTKASQEISDSN